MTVKEFIEKYNKEEYLDLELIHWDTGGERFTMNVSFYDTKEDNGYYDSCILFSLKERIN